MLMKDFTADNTKIRLVACDMDGTLLDTESRLGKRTEDALRKLREKGVTVVLASGRTYESIRETMPAGTYDYAVAENGCAVYEAEGDRLLCSASFPKGYGKEIVKLMKGRHVLLAMTADGVFRAWCRKEDSFLFELFQRVRGISAKLMGKDPVYYHVESDPCKAEEIPCRKYCFASLPFILRHIAHEADPHFCSCWFVTPAWLEIVPAGVSKGSGLSLIMEKENISYREAACIGDGENDLPVFEKCVLKAAMGNAMRALRSEADVITADNRHEGAAKWIESLLEQTSPHV